MVSTGERTGTLDEEATQPPPEGARGAEPPEASEASDDTVTGGAGPDGTGTDAPERETTPADTRDGDGVRPARQRILMGAVVLLVIALVAAGIGLFVAGRQLRDTPATDNLALTDTAATTGVVGDVSDALGKIFTYGPQDTARTKESAKQLLAGKALQQYAALFGQVEKQAGDQKLTLTTHVVRAGVTRLSGTSAHLLVFLDQVYERRGGAATTAAAQLSVTAELRGGHWKIVDITAR
ncbi:hypothetical protein [Streptomyces sp. NPDC014734]|uniref:hypothetical protein n=1 Tax=Streptomyces sp. NPDC014734 TaxID=3364886 RepID=UPI0036F89595